MYKYKSRSYIKLVAIKLGMWAEAILRFPMYECELALALHGVPQIMCEALKN